MLIEVICRLSEEGSYEVNELKNKRENTFNQKIDPQNQNISIG